jgi:hypothetical protein
MASLQAITAPLYGLSTTVRLRDLPLCAHRRYYTTEPCQCGTAVGRTVAERVWDFATGMAVGTGLVAWWRG